MRNVFARTASIVLAVHVLAAAALADQVRVAVVNAPRGVPLVAILNAGNDSKPLTRTGSSTGGLSFAMLTDAANFGKPVQVFLVEEDDDDGPAVIYLVLDGGAVPAGARLLDVFTLTAATSEVVVDYRTGRVSVRETSGEVRERGTSFGTGLQIGFHGEWISFTNAGGGTICSTAPPGAALTRCDLDKSGGSFMFSALYGFRPWLSAGLGYETGSEVKLNRVVANAANPNVTATQDFVYDPKVLELFGRVSMPYAQRFQLTGLFGAARVTSRSTNSFVTRLGTNVVNTQSTNPENESWSPLLGGSATFWLNRWLGVESGYRWLRMKDGDVDEPMHIVSFGVQLNVGPHR